MGRCADIWDKEQYSFYAKAIYCLLGKFVNKKGECWPSTRLLAKMAGITRPTIEKYICELESGGAIIVLRKKTDYGDNDNNRYVLPDLIQEGGKGDLPPRQPDLPGVVKDVGHGGKPDLPGVVKDVGHNYINITNPYNLSSITNKNIIPAPDGACVLFTPAEIEDNTSGAQERDRAKTAPPNHSDGKGALPVEKATGKGEEFTPEFLDFYAHYPRKGDKQRAFRMWKARKREGVPAADMILAAERYAAVCKGKDAEFIKMAKTFIGPDRPFMELIGADIEISRNKPLVNQQQNWETKEQKAARLAKPDCPKCKGTGSYSYVIVGIPDLVNPGEFIKEPETHTSWCDCWKSKE